MHSSDKILIVDDDTKFLNYIKKELGDIFNILTTNSGEKALKLLEKNSPVALVVSNYFVSEMSGSDFLEIVQEKYPETVRMIITDMPDMQPIMDFMNNINIFRFIYKSCSPEELGESIENAVRQYNLVQSEKTKKEEVDAAYKQLVQYAKDLNEIVTSLKNKNKELNEAYLDTIHRLVIASEYKDEDTHEHIIRMSRYSALLAELVKLPPTDVENILFASPMHDIGKIGIPDAIMMKPGKLTNEEFEQMKTHTTIGAKILEGAKNEILNLAKVIAISHHERWNGKGYPNGISGEDIPFAGRIVALADTFDALTSKRPYKDPYPVNVAYDIIKKERGEQFDPVIVDVFVNNFDKFIKIKEEVSPFVKNNHNNFKLSERDSE